MDFKQLFNTQAELDATINKNHPVQEKENRLADKVIALLTELGECANEWRGFKFWSTDKAPRNKCMKCQIIETPHQCEVPLLEEYADCLAFALSIGLELGVRMDSVYLLEKSERTIQERFIGLMVGIGLLNSHGGAIRQQSYKQIFADLIRLGLKLGFTLEQIEAAYYDKNKINHQRQASGY